MLLVPCKIYGVTEKLWCYAGYRWRAKSQPRWHSLYVEFQYIPSPLQGTMLKEGREEVIQYFCPTIYLRTGRTATDNVVNYMPTEDHSSDPSRIVAVSVIPYYQLQSEYSLDFY